MPINGHIRVINGVNGGTVTINQSGYYGAGGFYSQDLAKVLN